MLLAAALVLASVTESLADFATRVVGDLGLPGVFLLMIPQACCIPIPSEVTMLFAGFNVSEGKYPLVAAIAVGAAGDLVGSWIAYAIGYYGRLELLERSRFFHVTGEQITRAEGWFERWGARMVFFGRLLPVARNFVSLPAGAARMPLGRFTALTVVGSTIWITILTLVGRAARDHWSDWKDRLHYVDYVAAALIVLAVVYLGQRWWRARRARVAAADAA